ncbi:MAG: hypothetical protein MSP55_00170 [Fusobacterium necrophorum]|nr:hypothetical protein [Fusobacterium necrophorum]
MSTKEIIEKRVKSLTISIKREKAILQELESDRATIQRIQEWEETGGCLGERFSLCFLRGMEIEFAKTNKKRRKQLRKFENEKSGIRSLSILFR